MPSASWNRARSKSVKFGAKYTDHDRDLVFNATTYGGFHVPINTTPGSVLRRRPLTPGDYLDGLVRRPGTLHELLADQQGRDPRHPVRPACHAPSAVLYPQQSFSVSEKTYGGYVMGNLEGDGWRGNVGVRYVQTEQTSDGNDRAPDGAIENPFGNYDPISVDRDYDDMLPSLNLAFDLTDDVVLRFAAARVMARPDYTDVAPRVNLNPGALTRHDGQSVTSIRIARTSPTCRSSGITTRTPRSRWRCTTRTSSRSSPTTP